MNKADSERIAGYLDCLGFFSIENRSEADLVILTTCGVRQSAEDRIYGFIPKIKRENKNAKIILTGCLSERDDVKKRIGDRVDIWLPIKDLAKLKDLLEIEKPHSFEKDYLNIKPRYSSEFTVFVPIGNGCDNFCAYCVVPYARGREVYRSADKIIKEVESLVDNGCKEIVLIAQNVNSYKSGKVDFPDLLKMVNDIPGNFWIRFATSHPKDMSDKLIKTISKCEKVCEHIHLPAQSGDNNVLKAMNRKYTISRYKNLIKKIRKYIPNASISTDIIVGFPGETRKQFANTKKLFKEVKYDLAYIAQYSPRPGTAAEMLDDNILKSEKKKREEELIKILKKTSLENNKKYIGKIVDVLIEGKNKKGEWYGKTRTYKSTKVKSKKLIIGEFTKVKITNAKDFGLEGELADKKAIVILGPTSSGKTGLGVKLAHKYNGEIISADSRQVYKGMDIGTGKDLDEYEFKERGKKVKIPYHLIDVVSPKEEYSLARYQKECFDAMDDILNRGKLPLIVGGTGLYIQSIVDNYNLSSAKPNKDLRKKLEKLNTKKVFERLRGINKKFADNLNESEKKNKRRIIRYIEILEEGGRMKKERKTNFNYLVLGIKCERKILLDRICERLVHRLEKEKMIEEVERLNQEGVSWKRLESFGLEYRHISLYLQAKLDYYEMVEKLNIAIRQFAKRQMTWFRRWEKQGQKIFWIKNKKEAESLIKNFIK